MNQNLLCLLRYLICFLVFVVSRLDNVEYKAGDVISVREIKQDNKTIKENIEANKARPTPEWLEKDNEKLQVKVIRLAAREDVDIPSYLIKAGDVISVREIKKDNKTIKENMEVNKAKPMPEWLERDIEKLQVKVIRLAAREDVDIPVEEHLIVELYSK